MARERTPITAEDLYRFQWLDHVRLDPSGRRVAWDVHRPDAETRENRARIWVAGTSGGRGEAVTDGTRDRAPEWSPDGRHLAYLSKRGQRDQIFLLDPDLGPGRPLTAIQDGVVSFRWSPDGRRLAFTARVPSEPDLVVEDPRPPEGPALRRPPVARVVRGFDWRFNGAGFFDGRRVHLFVIDVDPKATVLPEPRQVTHGGWSVEGYDWSPDGDAFVITGDAQPGADLRRARDVSIVPLAGGVPEPIVSGLAASGPRWAPDGRSISFMAPRDLAAGHLQRAWVVDAGAGHEPRCLTADFDVQVGGGVIGDLWLRGGPGLRWSEDSSRLFFLGSSRGATNVYSVDLGGVVRAELAPAHRAIFDFDVAGGLLAFGANNPVEAGDVYLAALEAPAERQVTDLNPWLRERSLVSPEEQTFTAGDGLELQGWLLRPQGASEARRAPLVLEIHGGPNGMYGWTFMHEFQLLCANGIGVLYLNPRGSDGYGEEFMHRVVQDWGGGDAEDLLLALDQLVAREPWVDDGRLGVAGGSYGGYMTNWLIGHTTRFRAAVSMRSICNLVSEYTQHDIVMWGTEQLGPIEWPDPENLWRRSPIRYVRDIETPLLLLHGEADLRCAISQAEELFGALHLLGKEVELVRFPGESHDLSRNGRPDRRVERLNRILRWFQSHLTAPRRRSTAGTRRRKPAAAGAGARSVSDTAPDGEAATGRG
ncbi:MAG: S9 family peptidase [Candidatus Dormibacteraeota bacterium]|nr:S9 family peptidase [Candidatus Dormibacteraeota bacterium]